MKKPPIATVINFCTNEARFLEACVEQARLFSRQILVPVCDAFFDGRPENRELLEAIYAAFPDCQFIEYPLVPKRVPRKRSPAHFWPSASRCLASHFLNEEIESVLFLDADEVVDGKKFLEWLDASDYAQHSVLKLANFWYFREPQFQATRWEDSIVLAQRRALSAELLLQDGERDAIYDLLPGPKRRHVTGVDGQPMVHHFSWVRTKNEMIRKVESWSHRNDRNWTKLVEEEFSGPFKGIDFIHGYAFRSVAPPFAISLEERRFTPRGAPSVRKMSVAEWDDLMEISEPFWSKWIYILKNLFRKNLEKNVKSSR